MKKFCFSVLATLTFTLVFALHSSAEARHCRSSSVHVGVGSGYVARSVPVVRRAPAPVVMAPVYVPAAPYYYAPYGTPMYVCQPQPYVEEVYVARPAPLSFGGLSFSWNFFK